MAATNKVFSLKTVLACQDEISEKLKKVRTNLRSLDRAFDRVSRSAGDVASKVFAPLMAVGGAGLFSVASSVQTFIELGDAIDKASQRAGVGTGALQKLRFAAKLSGMDAEEMDRALSKLSGEMGKAASGENKKLSQLFSDLGVSWKDAKGHVKDSATVFRELSEAIKVNENPAARLQILTDVFGDKLAARLIPLMKDGAAGLDEMSKKAEELGIVVSSDDVKAAAELGDTMDIFHMSLSALQTTIGARLAPVIKRVVERLEDVIGRNKELISQKIAEAVQAFSDALERVPWDTVITVISSVISAFGWVFNAIGGVNTILAVLAGVGIGRFIMSVARLVSALNGVRVVFMASFGLPGLLIAGAVAAVVYLATVIYQHWDVISEKLRILAAKFYEVAAPVIRVLKTVFLAFAGVLAVSIGTTIDAISAIIRGLSPVIRVIGGALVFLAGMVRDAFVALTFPIRAAWDALKPILQPIFDWIMSKLDALANLAPSWLKDLVGWGGGGAAPAPAVPGVPATGGSPSSPAAGVGSMTIHVVGENGAKARIDNLDARNMNISADAKSYDPGDSF